MPFILPLSYTKRSAGRADVQQLQKNKLIEKENKSGGGAGHFNCQVTLAWDNLLHFVTTDKGRHRIPAGTLRWTPPRPSLEPSAQQSPTSPGPEEHRDTMTGRKLTKDTKEGTPDLVSFPELPQPQSPDLKPIKMNQCQSTFWRYLGSSWSGLVCPDASSWEHWDLEVATGQTL